MPRKRIRPRNEDPDRAYRLISLPLPPLRHHIFQLELHFDRTGARFGWHRRAEPSTSLGVITIPIVSSYETH